MAEFMDTIYQFLTNQRVLEVIKAILIVCVGVVIAKAVTGAGVRILKNKFGTHEIQATV